MTNDVLLESLALLFTYLLHSTLCLGGVWLLLRLRLVRGLAAENSLWKLGLVGGLVTTSVQSGLGLEPWSVPLQTPAVETASHARPAQVAGDAGARTELAAPARRAAAPGSAAIGAPLQPSGWLTAPAPVRPAGESEGVRAPAEAPAALPARLGEQERLASGPVTTEPVATGPAAAGPAAMGPLAPGRTPSRSAPRATPGAHRPLEPTTGSANVSAPLGWPALILGLWVVLAGAGLGRVVALRRHLARTLRTRREVTDPEATAILERLCRSAGVGSEVRLTVSPLLAGPIALGKSEVCLPPRALEELDPQRLEAILAHELAHLVRRDPLWLHVCGAIEALFFFQPLNRFARRRIQETAEFLCDDWAVSRTGRGLVLARCLAEVASWFEEARRPLPAMAMARRDSALVQRVRRLADGSAGRARARAGRGLVLGSTLLLAVSCGVPAVSADARVGFVAELMATLEGGAPRSEVAAPSRPRLVQLVSAVRALSEPLRDGGDVLTLRVVDGRVVGLRLGKREVDLEGELGLSLRVEGVTGSGSVRVSDDRGRALLVLDIRSEDAGEEVEGEWSAAEWAEVWDSEVWDPEVWGEAEEIWNEVEEELRESVWDSQSVGELGAELQQLEREYTQRQRQGEREFNQRVKQFQRESQQVLEQASRELQQAVQQWNQEFQAGQQQRIREWDQASRELNRELEQLQREGSGDASAYRDLFEAWQERYEEALEEHEHSWDEWEAARREAYEETTLGFSEEQSEVRESHSEQHEEILEAHEEELEELEEWFTEQYEELLERFEARLGERRAHRDCDHDCKRRCADGCTHPEERPEPAELPELEEDCEERGEEPAEPGQGSVVWNRPDGNRPDGDRLR